MMDGVCVICNEGFHEIPAVKVHEKGLKTLIRFSTEKNLHDLSSLLKDAMKDPNATILVHHDCRRNFVKFRTATKPSVPEKKLRSSLECSFDWKSKCFLCTKNADKKYSTVSRAETLPFVKTLIDHCLRRDDNHAKEVHGRLSSCNDLVAEEAIYHVACMTHFRLWMPSDKKRGRPIDTSMTENFKRICAWLEEETDSELYTLQELHIKMEELSENTPCYSLKSLKRKLMEHYGDHIFFSELPGRHNLVCFKDMASFLLNKLREMQKQTPIDIVTTAAKIIKSDLRVLTCDKSEYPLLGKMNDIEYCKSWVPESLLIFLQHLIPSELKQVTIGQCIAQASRSRSMLASIPFGIGIGIDKSFATRWLVDHLASLGLSISSDEVKLFKQSAAVSDTTESTAEHFTQWVADNVDHNIHTLTGKGTFHGMGIISICSGSKSNFKAISRRRHKSITSLADCGVKVQQYYGASYQGLRKLSFKSIASLAPTMFTAPEMTLDLLWHSAWFFTSRTDPRPNWSGYMQHVTSRPETIHDSATINFLPILDLNSSNETCIYSTLLFVIEEGKRIGIPTPCITFDQPLWLKATGIIKEKNLNLVCRLGGFHMLMSFLGSIGKLMVGSGLEELFEEVYSADTVKHMFSGKAVARTLRAHMLTQSSLISHLLDALVDGGELDLSVLEKIYKNLMETGMNENDVLDLSTTQIMKDLEERLTILINNNMRKSRTAKLWLLYVQYINIVKEYILSERTCNWALHLQTVQKMMNLFAASGHINYAKCSRLYVQEMLSLEYEKPWLYQQFMNGKHAVRRSSRFWSGLWSDLVIEQTMMRSLKTSGGLTRGRGFEDNVRHLWVKSISYTAAVHESMISLSGVNMGSSDQNKEMGLTRRICDFDDCSKFYNWFVKRNPFNVDGEDLHSLSTGVIAVHGKDAVNCDEAENIGSKIQERLDKVNFTDAKIKKKDQFVSLGALSRSVKIDGKNPLSVNHTVLFTRLAAIAQREDDVEEYFSYDLTPKPMALFKNELMRKPDKAALRNALLPEETDIPTSQDISYVLDGGALLHRVYWVKDIKFYDIANEYICYVRRNYGTASIIFDGYDDDMSIKANEHARRLAMKGSTPNIKISENNQNPYPKERFLSNPNNKKELISLLSTSFKSDSQEVFVCKGDADCKIASTALELAKEKCVVVVADDTDVVVMLLHHWKEHLNDIFFLSGTKCWSIKDGQCRLDDIKDHLLFIHAWSGCDSTSAIFGKGKPTFMKLLKKSWKLKNLSETMNDFWATEKDVGEAAISAFIELYGGNAESNLTKLRYAKYQQMVCEGVIEPEKLPPTERAAWYHGLRVHLQIIQWKMLDEEYNLDPRKWGWKLENGILSPVPTDKEVAPPNILQVIRCKCKLDTKNPCGTNVCSCRKNGLKCMPACGGCHGEDCNNQHEVTSYHDDNGIDDENERNIFETVF